MLAGRLSRSVRRSSSTFHTCRACTCTRPAAAARATRCTSAMSLMGTGLPPVIRTRCLVPAIGAMALIIDSMACRLSVSARLTSRPGPGGLPTKVPAAFVSSRFSCSRSSTGAGNGSIQSPTRSSGPRLSTNFTAASRWVRPAFCMIRLRSTAMKKTRPCVPAGDAGAGPAAERVADEAGGAGDAPVAALAVDGPPALTGVRAATRRGVPSTVTTKSATVRPSTGRPSRSTTVTSDSIRSTPER